MGSRQLRDLPPGGLHRVWWAHTAVCEGAPHPADGRNGLLLGKGPIKSYEGLIDDRPPRAPQPDSSRGSDLNLQVV